MLILLALLVFVLIMVVAAILLVLVNRFSDEALESLAQRLQTEARMAAVTHFTVQQMRDAARGRDDQ